MGATCHLNFSSSLRCIFPLLYKATSHTNRIVFWVLALVRVRVCVRDSVGDMGSVASRSYEGDRGRPRGAPAAPPRLHRCSVGEMGMVGRLREEEYHTTLLDREADIIVSEPAEAKNTGIVPLFLDRPQDIE